MLHRLLLVCPWPVLGSLSPSAGCEALIREPWRCRHPSHGRHYPWFVLLAVIKTLALVHDLGSLRPHPRRLHLRRTSPPPPSHLLQRHSGHITHRMPTAFFSIKPSIFVPSHHGSPGSSSWFPPYSLGSSGSRLMWGAFTTTVLIS